MPTGNTVIRLWADTSAQDATIGLAQSFITHMHGTVALLPSSLDDKDLFVNLIEQQFHQHGQPFIALPVTGASARRAFLTPTVLGRWIDRPVRSPGTTVTSVTWPQDVIQADHRIIVTDVVEVARRGPFVLDLPARYLHPRQRMRLLGSGQREGLTAEVASAFPLDLAAIYLGQRQGTILAMTTDFIAAELVALALSELCIGAPRSFSGPWEDPVVQAATELQMGVLLPQRIRIILDGPERDQDWAQRIVEHISMRLGIPRNG